MGIKVVCCGLLGPHSRAAARQLMHRRRSLSPAVLTRAEIPHLKHERSGIQTRQSSVSVLAAAAGSGGNTWQNWARSTYQTVQEYLHAVAAPVLDGGEDRGLADTSRLRSFRQRERYALSHRRPRSQRGGDVIPDPLYASSTPQRCVHGAKSGTANSRAPRTSAQTRMSNAVFARLPQSFSNRSRQACARANCWAIC